MNFLLHHRTDYRYSRPVFLNPHCIRLRPAASCPAEVLHYQLRVFPEPVQTGWQVDPLGNRVAQVSFDAPTGSLSLHVNMRLRVRPSNPFNFVLEPWAVGYPFEYPEPMRVALTPFLAPSSVDVPAGLLLPGSTVERVLEVARWVATTIAYQVRDEEGTYDPQETLRLGIGSCRDQAWLAVNLYRAMGLAARQVSGYLMPQHTLDPAQARLDRVGGGELHAWAEIYLPGAGWVGLDASSGLLASSTHVALACAPDPSGTAPLEGNLGYSGETPQVVSFKHHVTIRRAPRNF